MNPYNFWYVKNSNHFQEAIKYFFLITKSLPQSEKIHNYSQSAVEVMMQYVKWNKIQVSCHQF